MCGRFSLFVDQSTIEDRFDAEAVEPIEPRYNIAPGDELVTLPNDDSEHFDRQQWGLRPHWVDDPEQYNAPINARAETLTEKPMFRSAFERRRCLVVADGFYEWQGETGSKRPYRIERVDDEPFAFAGIWETWGENGQELETVAIITTDSNDAVEPIHDRMPVMLEPNDEATWLEEDDPGELKSILDPYPADLTEAYEISTAVNNPENDTADIIEPLGHDQSGLGQYS